MTYSAAVSVQEMVNAGHTGNKNPFVGVTKPLAFVKYVRISLYGEGTVPYKEILAYLTNAKGFV